jgi:hypothetical protein
MFVLTDSLFLVFSIFLIAEILSQVLQLEAVGQVFTKFYAVIVHILILTALFTYEDQQLLNYFIALIALVNSLRYVIYRIPLIEKGPWIRFFIDMLVLVILGSVVYFAFNLLDINLIVKQLSLQVKYAYLASLVIVLIYEMFQKASEVGLQTSKFLPQSLSSFVIEYSLLITGLMMVVGLFVFSDQVVGYLFLALPVYVAINIIVVLISNLKDSRYAYQYSLSYVLPTFVSILFFLAVIL